MLRPAMGCSHLHDFSATGSESLRDRRACDLRTRCLRSPKKGETGEEAFCSPVSGPYLVHRGRVRRSSRWHVLYARVSYTRPNMGLMPRGIIGAACF